MVVEMGNGVNVNGGVGDGFGERDDDGSWWWRRNMMVVEDQVVVVVVINGVRGWNCGGFDGDGGGQREEYQWNGEVEEVEGDWWC